MSNPDPVVEHPDLIMPGDPGTAEPSQETEFVGSPGKVMRIGTMVKQLLEEVKSAPLDDASRVRLAGIHQRSIDELGEALSPDLQEELRSLAPPFTGDETPSDAELRIAQAQLVGWLEGLFHGIQATLFAQQLAARQQLDGMRGRIGPGSPNSPSADDSGGRPGTYL